MSLFIYNTCENWCYQPQYFKGPSTECTSNILSLKDRCRKELGIGLITGVLVLNNCRGQGLADHMCRGHSLLILPWPKCQAKCRSTPWVRAGARKGPSCLAAAGESAPIPGYALLGLKQIWSAPGRWTCGVSGIVSIMVRPWHSHYHPLPADPWGTAAADCVGKFMTGQKKTEKNPPRAHGYRTSFSFPLPLSPATIHTRRATSIVPFAGSSLVNPPSSPSSSRCRLFLSTGFPIFILSPLAFLPAGRSCNSRQTNTGCITRPRAPCRPCLSLTTCAPSSNPDCICSKSSHRSSGSSGSKHASRCRPRSLRPLHCVARLHAFTQSQREPNPPLPLRQPPRPRHCLLCFHPYEQQQRGRLGSPSHRRFTILLPSVTNPSTLRVKRRAQSCTPPIATYAYEPSCRLSKHACDFFLWTRKLSRTSRPLQGKNDTHQHKNKTKTRSARILFTAAQPKTSRNERNRPPPLSIHPLSHSANTVLCDFD